MVFAAFRYSTLILALIFPLCVQAGTGPPVHQALDNWLRDGGVADSHYRATGIPELPADWPAWLLRPAGPDALNRHFLEQGLTPEAVTLDWRKAEGVVAIFGRAEPDRGLRLVVDRDRERPVALHLRDGTTWRLRDFESAGDRRGALPGAIVRVAPDGSETVFQRTE